MSSQSSDTPSTGVTFEQQRDYLVQEIASAMDSVVYNLDILNRSLSESVQVGKDFENVGRLWSTFYNGLQNDGDTSAKQPPEFAKESHVQGITTTERSATPETLPVTESHDEPTDTKLQKS